MFITVMPETLSVPFFSDTVYDSNSTTMTWSPLLTVLVGCTLEAGDLHQNNFQPLNVKTVNPNSVLSRISVDCSHFGPHRIHEMRTIASTIADPGVCHSVTRAGCVQTAGRIEVLFEVETPEDLTNIVWRRWGSMRPLPNHYVSWVIKYWIDTSAWRRLAKKPSNTCGRCGHDDDDYVNSSIQYCINGRTEVAPSGEWLRTLASVTDRLIDWQTFTLRDHRPQKSASYAIDEHDWLAVIRLQLLQRSVGLYCSLESWRSSRQWPPTDDVAWQPSSVVTGNWLDWSAVWWMIAVAPLRSPLSLSQLRGSSAAP